MPCWEATLALPTCRNLCAWQIELEIKRIQSIWLSNIYVGWWFKLQSLKNLALSKLEPCPFFFPSIVSLESMKKGNIFPCTRAYKQHLHFRKSSKHLQNERFSLWTGKKHFQCASVEGNSCRDWAVWSHCKAAGSNPVVGLTLHQLPGPWALRPCSTTRHTGSRSEDHWHYLSTKDLKASCHLNCR